MMNQQRVDWPGAALVARLPGLRRQRGQRGPSQGKDTLLRIGRLAALKQFLQARIREVARDLGGDNKQATAQLREEFDKLQAENAELRARFTKLEVRVADLRTDSSKAESRADAAKVKKDAKASKPKIVKLSKTSKAKKKGSKR